MRFKRDPKGIFNEIQKLFFMRFKSDPNLIQIVFKWNLNIF